MSEQHVHLGVGTVSAIVEDPDSGRTVPVVALSFQKTYPVSDDPKDPENFDDIYITIPAAREMIINLKQSIDDALALKLEGD